MHSHHIEEMTEAIAVTLKVNGTAREAIKDALTEYWYDKIAIVWTTEDVRSCKRGISEEDAVEALQKVLRDSDASIGVRWDHIVDACGGTYPDEEDEDGDEAA